MYLCQSHQCTCRGFTTVYCLMFKTLSISKPQKMYLQIRKPLEDTFFEATHTEIPKDSPTFSLELQMFVSRETVGQRKCRQLLLEFRLGNCLSGTEDLNCQVLIRDVERKCREANQHHFLLIPFGASMSQHAA